MTSIDLQAWCVDPWVKQRPLSRPWTRDKYTYATNGSALIRVPARADVPDNPNAPDVARAIPADIDTRPMSPLAMALPAPIRERCDYCDGTGREAECEARLFGGDCSCCPACGTLECVECNGTGYLIKWPFVTLRGKVFRSDHLRLLLPLPGLHADLQARSGMPMCFRFDGGIALVMARDDRFHANKDYPDCEVKG